MPRSEEFDEKYLLLQRAYLENLPQKVSTIEDHWSMLVNINWSHSRVADLQLCVHKLAGSAGGYGLNELSNAARRLDEALCECSKFNHPPELKQKTAMTQLVKEIIEQYGVTQSSSINSTEIDPLSHKDTKILIIDDDEEYSELIQLMCSELGCEVEAIHNLENAIDRIKMISPDLIIMDIVFPEGGLAGIDTIKAINSEVGYNIPVIFSSSRSDLSSRLKAYRAGGSGYLTKPFNSSELRAQLDLQHASTIKGSKVLIIDDDETVRRSLSQFLKSQGFSCSSSNNSALIIHMLEKHTPDILILDMDSPRINGNDIIKVLEQDTKYMGLPIVCISAQPTNRELKKPLELNKTLSLIRNSLKRSILQKGTYTPNNEQVSEKEVTNHNQTPAIIENTLELQKSLADSIEYCFENHTLFLSYQPIIDANGDEKMFEGYGRIKDEENNIIMPSTFMPELIRHAKQKEFNRHLVQKSIDDISILKGTAAEEVEIIIKLMASDTPPMMFLSWVSNIMRSARIRGKNRLIFSIAEENAMQYSSSLDELHQNIHGLSCGFMLDHAGSTHNTQEIIDTGHFEYIKLARNIIEGVKNDNTESIAFVKTLLEQDVSLVAPFIEDSSTLSALWKIGVRYFQGYFVRKPEQSLHFDFKIEEAANMAH